MYGDIQRSNAAPLNLPSKKTTTAPDQSEDATGRKQLSIGNPSDW